MYHLLLYVVVCHNVKVLNVPIVTVSAAVSVLCSMLEVATMVME